MRLFAGLALAAMTLSACGGVSDRQAMINSCMETGDDSKEACTCLVDKLEDSLSPEVFAAVASASREEDDDKAGAIIEALSPLDQMSLGLNMLDAAASCEASLF